VNKFSSPPVVGTPQNEIFDLLNRRLKLTNHNALRYLEDN